MPELNKLSAIEQIELVKQGSITAVQLLTAHLKQIHKREKDIRGWVYLDINQAMETAEEIDRQVAAGVFRGCLFGIPVGVKDVFNTADMPTEMGNSLWKGFHPGNDARVVSVLRREGAVFLGKTVTAEFGVHSPGPTHNPYRQGFMPGTSSSGSAAAVASYMVPLALGTQTAGSTLRPASYCGVYGFKPSFGLLPRTGMLKTTDTLDNVGLLARTLDDIILMFETLRVQGSDYPLVHRTLDQYHSSLKQLRVAFVIHPKWEFAEDYAKQAIESFVAQLNKKKSAKIKTVKLPMNFYRVHDIHERIYDRCLAYYFKKESQHHDQISKSFWEMVEKGKKITLDQYREDLSAQERISQELDHWFKDFDVVLTLTTGGEAMKGLNTFDRPDSCLIWTFCGVPALSVPLFTGPSDLPFGLQVVARKYHDYTIFDFVRELIEE